MVLQAVVRCEDCGSENTWHHEEDCPHYRPITEAEINASLMKEPERASLRISNTTQSLRKRIVALSNGHSDYPEAA